jgi:hypothetical protein
LILDLSKVIPYSHLIGTELALSSSHTPFNAHEFVSIPPLAGRRLRASRTLDFADLIRPEGKELGDKK